ncbi:MAG TPA: MAPEG family protein [Candidatus Binatia bacterium]|nr:MAPEG family protein [Candidatus Binatia bacterium]
MNLAMNCIGLLALLCMVLGLRVSMLRRASSVSIGCSSDPTDPLHKFVRAHCNACEYAPILAILIFALASGGATGITRWLFVLAVVFRYMHAVGMIVCQSLEQAHPLRFIGALGTYVVGILLAIGAIFQQ